MEIEHIAINVPSPIEMAKWYEENLGMRVVRRVEGGPETHFILDGGGRVILEIYNNPEAPVPDYWSQDPLVFHMAFSTENIETECDKLIAAGAKKFGEPKVTPAGDTLAMLQDPWGVAVQLVTRKDPLPLK